jgi:hypothetical protein
VEREASPHAGRRPSTGGFHGREDNLADEAKLLRSVDAALRQADLATARTQLDTYRRTFAAGSLGAQADELALLLACADDPQAASKRALDHLHAHPGSRARARIEDACGLP